MPINKNKKGPRANAGRTAKVPAKKPVAKKVAPKKTVAKKVAKKAQPEMQMAQAPVHASDLRIIVSLSNQNLMQNPQIAGYMRDMENAINNQPGVQASLLSIVGAIFLSQLGTQGTASVEVEQPHVEEQVASEAEPLPNDDGVVADDTGDDLV